MSTIVLEAETRTDMGKGASRRLRRLENKIPAVVYGGNKKPQVIHLLQNKIAKALENESIYSSVFQLEVDGKAQKVILKSLQRHPYKTLIMHMDFQRVSDKDILVKNIPIHFINEETCRGAKAGGIITHNMTQVEVRCAASKLPEFIEVDMANVDMNDVVHLYDIKLPKDVQLTVDTQEESHNLPVASIHAPKAKEEEAPAQEAEGEVEAEKTASAEPAEGDKKAEDSVEGGERGQLRCRPFLPRRDTVKTPHLS